MPSPTPATDRPRDTRPAGNLTVRHHNTAILSVTAVDAPIVVTSDSFDEQLASTYDRIGFRAGMLSQVAGIIERRWWTPDVSFADAAAMAGEKAITEAGHRPGPDRPADRHLGLPRPPGAEHGGGRAPPARAEVGLHELRPVQRVPGLRQRDAAGRDDDRLRSDRVRPGRRRRGQPAHPGAHARALGASGRDHGRT